MMTSGNSRIVRRGLANGDISFTFSVVRNMRLNGRPSHVTLARLATFRQSEFTARAEEFWSIVDTALIDLVKTNKLWNQCRLKVEKQFEAVIPRPASAVAKTVEASPESDYELMRKIRAEFAEKAERKLAARGVSVQIGTGLSRLK